MIALLPKRPGRRGHPRPRVLSRYLDGDLAPREYLAVSAHLRECSGCRRLLASLSQTIRALGSMSVRSRPGLADSIVATLRAESTSHERTLE